MSGGDQTQVPTAAEKPLLAASDIARILGVSHRTAYRYIVAGTWPTITVGRRTMVPTAAFRRWAHIDG